MSPIRLQACLLVGLAVMACTRPATPPQPAVVATVGEGVVLASELREELERVRRESGEAPDPGAFEALRAGVLESLIERRLLLDEARRSGVAVTDEEVETLMSRRDAAAAHAPSGTAVPAPEEMRARLRDQLLVDRLLVREVVGRTALGTDDARQWYDTHVDELAGGERVRALQIVTRTAEEAQAARREALRGVDFATLARTRSVAPDARAGGDLGWFAPGQMPPVVEQACFALRKGQISEVVESPWGHHVFKLVGREAGGAPSFDSARPAIELELRRQAVARAQAEYLSGLRQRAGVTVDEAEVARVQSPDSSEPRQ